MPTKMIDEYVQERASESVYREERESQVLPRKNYEKEIRLSFLKIDEKTREDLRKFRKVLQSHLPEVLDEFYSHIGSIPQLNRMVGGKIAHLKQIQGDHWLNLFNANFEESYMDRVTSIGQTHERIGLEPRWYIGGYCLALNYLLGLAVKKHRFNPSACTRMVQSITKAVFCDMELAITIYNDNIRETAAQKLQLAVDQINKNVNVVACSIEEMTASMMEISRNAGQSAAMSNKLRDTASMTQEQITTLNNSVKEIENVIALINNIASQTNLLALNATIEAASAGEAGKGFAVVADEVKTLARQSAEATENIRNSIMTMMDNMGHSASAVKEIFEVIVDMNTVNNSIASAVEEQTAVAGEINQSILNVMEAAKEATRSFST